MANLELTCELRDTRTKGQVKALRRAGKVPGILYGPKTRPVPLMLPANELESVLGAITGQRLIQLHSSSAELDSKYVIVKELQRGVLKGEILHADLYEVDLARRVRVEVPLRFVGRARGVVEGGILQPLRREVEIECLPQEIPDSIEVDVSQLGIHETIHLSELKVGENLELVLGEEDEPVVTVVPPAVEAAPAAEEAEAPAAGGETAEGGAAASATPRGAQGAPSGSGPAQTGAGPGGAKKS